MCFLLYHSTNIGTQKIGEVCGLCTDAEKDFFCGHCEPGLECFDSLPNQEDDPLLCRKIKGNINSLNFHRKPFQKLSLFLHPISFSIFLLR